LVTVVAAAAVIDTMIGPKPAPRFVWNVSESVPTGLYQAQPTRDLIVTTLVVAYPPEPLATLLEAAVTCREMYHLSSAFSPFQVRPCAAPAPPLLSMASKWASHASATTADACSPFGRVAIAWRATRYSS